MHFQRRTVLLGCAGALSLPASADLTAVIAAAKPALVAVGTFSATDSPRFGFRGTGFAVGDGTHVVTSQHVLPPAGTSDDPALMVLVPSLGDRSPLRSARVAATDSARDLVLLKIEGPPLSTLKLDEAGAAREGQAVALIGFPIGGALGFSAVTHRGIIASITTAALPAPTSAQLDPRAVTRLRAGNFEVFQLDATAYPGNSGGPLLDADSGRVVGVVNMVLIRGSRETALSAPTGISYAIPVRYLHELLKRQ